MCLSPITIPNPSYRSRRALVDLPVDESSLRVRRYVQNTTSRFIQVPCNHCSECRAVRQSQFVQRSIMQSQGYHAFMITLTYKNDMLPHLTLPFMNPETGEMDEVTFNFPDYRDVQNMFKRIRKYHLFDIDGERDFKYLVSSEYGGKKHRPHFHIILYLQKLSCDNMNKHLKDLRQMYLEQKVAAAIKKYWCRNIGTSKYPVYIPLCDYVRKGRHSSFQCEYVRERPRSGGIFDASKAAVNDVSFYVTKYCLKFDSYENFLWRYLDKIYPYIIKDDILWNHSRDALKVFNSDGRVPFSVYWNLLRPKVAASKFFGYSDLDQVDYMYKHVINSLNDKESSPKFVNPLSGEKFNLCTYYVKKLVSYEQKIAFFDNLPSDCKDNDYDIFSYKPFIPDNVISDVNQEKQSIRKASSIRRRIQSRNTDEFVSSCSNPTKLPDFLPVVVDVPLVSSPNLDFDHESPDSLYESQVYPDMPAEFLDQPKPIVFKQLSLFPDEPLGISVRSEIS